MTPGELHLVVPGPLDQLTGGYVYDARIVAELRALGWRVGVHNLAGRFPDPDAEARRALEAALSALPDGAMAVVDGLAMGGLPEPIEAHARRLRIVSLLHHPLSEETGLGESDVRRFRESERRALAPCRGVIVSSAFTARGLGAYGVGPDRVRVVVPGTEPARAAAGPPAGAPPVLLCVASVTPRKGHDVLVDALAALRALAWRCVCVGSLDRDRPHAADVLRRVAEAGLTDRIDFVGERHGPELDAIYHGASLFVLASHYEGYGMVLADALARGLPIVSTTGGAIPFTVPEDAAALVEPGDTAAFAEALRTLLTDAAARERRAAAAARHASTLPRWDEAARAFARAVEELAG